MGTTTQLPADPSLADAAPPQVEAQATPPIQLRSTYPAGMPPLGRPPQLLGAPPTSIAQLMYPMSGVASSHFTGALVSGATPGVQAAAGTALLALALQIDGSMGNFDLPIQFPGGSFLASFTAVTVAAGLPGVIVVNLGTQQTLADIGVITVPALGAIAAPVQPLEQLPIWGAVSPLVPFQIWLHVGGNTASAGITILVINYQRLASPWSGPAK